MIAYAQTLRMMLAVKLAVSVGTKPLGPDSSGKAM